MLPKLKVISNTGAGVDHIDLDAARQRGIPVGNTPGPLANTVADLLKIALGCPGSMVVRDGNRFTVDGRDAGIAKRTLERIESGKSGQLASIIRICRVLERLEEIDAWLPESPARG